MSGESVEDIAHFSMFLGSLGVFLLASISELPGNILANM